MYQNLNVHRIKSSQPKQQVKHFSVRKTLSVGNSDGWQLFNVTEYPRLYIMAIDSWRVLSFLSYIWLNRNQNLDKIN